MHHKNYSLYRNHVDLIQRRRKNALNTERKLERKEKKINHSVKFKLLSQIDIFNPYSDSSQEVKITNGYNGSIHFSLFPNMAEQRWDSVGS